MGNLGGSWLTGGLEEFGYDPDPSVPVAKKDYVFVGLGNDDGPQDDNNDNDDMVMLTGQMAKTRQSLEGLQDARQFITDNQADFSADHAVILRAKLEQIQIADENLEGASALVGSLESYNGYLKGPLLSDGLEGLTERLNTLVKKLIEMILRLGQLLARQYQEFKLWARRLRSHNEELIASFNEKIKDGKLVRTSTEHPYTKRMVLATALSVPQGKQGKVAPAGWKIATNAGELVSAINDFDVFTKAFNRSQLNYIESWATIAVRAAHASTLSAQFTLSYDPPALPGQSPVELGKSTFLVAQPLLGGAFMYFRLKKGVLRINDKELTTAKVMGFHSQLVAPNAGMERNNKEAFLELLNSQEQYTLPVIDTPSQGVKLLQAINGLLDNYVADHPFETLVDRLQRTVAGLKQETKGDAKTDYQKQYVVTSLSEVVSDLSVVATRYREHLRLLTSNLSWFANQSIKIF